MSVSPFRVRVGSRSAGRPPTVLWADIWRTWGWGPGGRRGAGPATPTRDRSRRSVSPATVTLAAGASTSVTVTMAASKGAAGGGHQARLTVNNGGSIVAHAAVYAFVK